MWFTMENEAPGIPCRGGQLVLEEDLISKI